MLLFVVVKLKDSQLCFFNNSQLCFFNNIRNEPSTNKTSGSDSTHLFIFFFATEFEHTLQIVLSCVFLPSASLPTRPSASRQNVYCLPCGRLYLIQRNVSARCSQWFFFCWCFFVRRGAVRLRVDGVCASVGAVCALLGAVCARRCVRGSTLCARLDAGCAARDFLGVCALCALMACALWSALCALCGAVCALLGAVCAVGCCVRSALCARIATVCAVCAGLALCPTRALLSIFCITQQTRCISLPYK